MGGATGTPASEGADCPLPPPALRAAGAMVPKQLGTTVADFQCVGGTHCGEARHASARGPRADSGESGQRSHNGLHAVASAVEAYTRAFLAPAATAGIGDDE